jgi:EmrB/QacA subfamily drug resistance transporter
MPSEISPEAPELIPETSHRAPPVHPSAPPGQGEAHEQSWLIPLMVLVVGTFMSVLDTSIVNVAVPKIQIELNAAPDDVEWMVTGFTLVLGMVVPLSGWLGDRLGPSRLYILSMVGFALASALCGLAWDLTSMIIFRVLQAIPGGILPVVSMTMLFRLVPPAKLGAAMGIFGLGVVVAPAIGPVLGGWLVEYSDWRLIFFINVPIGLVGVVAALAVFPKVRPTSWPKFDLWGFVTIAYGLAAILLALTEGQSWGWTGYRILTLLVSGTLSLALFVVIELEVDEPLINMRIFASRTYNTTLLLVGVAMTAMFSMMYFGPQFLQVVQGLQPLDAGLAMTPGAAVLLVLMPLTGRLSDVLGPRYPVTVGLALMGYGAYRLASLTPDTPRPEFVWGTVIIYFGAGLAMMPIMSAGVASLPPSLTSSGTGMNNVIQRAASSIAVAVLGSLGATASAQLMNDRAGLLSTGARALPEVTAMSEDGGASMMGGYYQALQMSVQVQTYNNGYFITSILCAAGALLALTLPSGKADPNAPKVHVEM